MNLVGFWFSGAPHGRITIHPLLSSAARGAYLPESIALRLQPCRVTYIVSVSATHIIKQNISMHVALVDRLINKVEIEMTPAPSACVKI